MSRRIHRKSRTGCINCKTRHIKCDETKPSCLHCEAASLQCEYPDRQGARGSAPLAIRQDISAAIAEAGPSSSSTPHAAELNRQRPASPLPTTDEGLNLDHLELMHHFCTVTYLTLSPVPVQQETWKTTVIKIGLSFPFVLREILAIAALHLAHCRPERHAHYGTLATELQNYALDGFNAIREHVDSSNYCAVMLFSWLLALHVIADNRHMQNLSHSEYLDYFLGYITLTRGVREIVIADWYAILTESELKPLLRVDQPEHISYEELPDECRELVNLPRSSDLGPALVQAYDRAIERLLWVLVMSGVPLTTRSTCRWILAWPVQIKDDFSTLLKERRPEALVILAYYGAYLHFYRESWTVGRSGVLLVTAVNAQVGSYWGRWLEWPNRIIEME